MKKQLTSKEVSNRYQQYISEFESMIHPDLKNEINEVREMDLHDYFFCPENWFHNEIEAKGFVLSLLLKLSRKKKDYYIKLHRQQL